MWKNKEIVELINKSKIRGVDIKTTVFNASRLDKNLYLGTYVKFVELDGVLHLVDCESNGHLSRTMKETACYTSLNAHNENELMCLFNSLA